MNPLQNDPPWKPIFWLGAAGALIFFIMQVFPLTSDSIFSETSIKVIDKAEAEGSAASFIRTTYGGEITGTHAVHQADRELIGYLSKEKLLEHYTDQYENRFPPDTYQVEVRARSGSKSEAVYFVYLHMESGDVVAWNRVIPDLSDEETAPGYDKYIMLAKSFAERHGFRSEELKARQTVEEDGSLVFDVIGGKVNDAQLQLRIRAVLAGQGDVKVLEYKPSFTVPEAYTSYVKKQDSLAAIMSFGGYLSLTFVLFILSIVYAALYRQHSSFKRGLFLTAVFLFFYIINNYNMADGIRAGMGEEPRADSLTTVLTAVSAVLSVLMAASVYFALVGGDALWRAMGRKLWSRFREPGYGGHVWRSMKISYLFALMFLGIQTVILLVLTNSIGTWATTDVTQSPYNFGALWLLPAMAWVAAISEEAVYRLFGIGLLYKWFKNLFAASLIPTVIWALGHVAYPLYPVTTRLIELTILGLIFSYAFIKFGFITAVFTHAIINTVLMSMMLFVHGSAVDIAAGIVYIVLPAVIAWLIRYWHNKKGPEPQVPDLTVPPSTPK